jgi:hypothetical protein
MVAGAPGIADGDRRSLPAAAQAALRSRAVRAVLKGMTQAEAARVFGVHHNAVNRLPHRPVPKRHRLMGDQTDAFGRTGQTPDGWTPDGPDTGRAGQPGP